jgi:hypothetical protein
MMKFKAETQQEDDKSLPCCFRVCAAFLLFPVADIVKRDAETQQNNNISNKQTKNQNMKSNYQIRKGLRSKLKPLKKRVRESERVEERRIEMKHMSSRERGNLKFDSTKMMSAEKFGKVQKKREIVSQKEGVVKLIHCKE